jgi:hypothetical protein
MSDIGENLKDRLLRGTIGSCSCRTKTPELQFHDDLCHSRLHRESLQVIEYFDSIYLSHILPLTSDLVRRMAALAKEIGEIDPEAPIEGDVSL